MSTRVRKAEIRKMLLRRDFGRLKNWSQSVRNPRRVLFSLSYDPDELIRCRAIEAIGHVCSWQARSDMERVRDYVRRLLWLMNDESGGLGWSSPEVLGEVLVNAPALIEEYGLLLTSFLREEPFQAGTHQAVYRVATVDVRPFAGSEAELSRSLQDDDPVVRGYAALTLGLLGEGGAAEAIAGLRSDEAEVRRYDFHNGDLHTTTVGRMALEAMELLQEAGCPA